MGIWKYNFISRFFHAIKAMTAPWGIEDYEPEVIEFLTKIDDCFIDDSNLTGYIKSFPLETEDDKSFVHDVMWASTYWEWHFNCKKIHWENPYGNLENTVTLLFYPK